MIKLHSFGVPHHHHHHTHTYTHILPHLGGFHSDAVGLTRCCFTVGLTYNMYCNLRILITWNKTKSTLSGQRNRQLLMELMGPVLQLHGSDCATVVYLKGRKTGPESNPSHWRKRWFLILEKLCWLFLLILSPDIKYSLPLNTDRYELKHVTLNLPWILFLRTTAIYWSGCEHQSCAWTLSW